VFHGRTIDNFKILRPASFSRARLSFFNTLIINSPLKCSPSFLLKPVQNLLLSLVDVSFIIVVKVFSFLHLVKSVHDVLLFDFVCQRFGFFCARSLTPRCILGRSVNGGGYYLRALEIVDEVIVFAFACAVVDSLVMVDDIFIRVYLSIVIDISGLVLMLKAGRLSRFRPKSQLLSISRPVASTYTPLRELNGLSFHVVIVLPRNDIEFMPLVGRIVMVWRVIDTIRRLFLGKLQPVEFRQRR
jgi:hypothetical protein